MNRILITATAMAASLTLTPLLAQDNEAGKQLNKAAQVLTEIMATPDNAIPDDLIQKAHCVVIVPDLKNAGFIVGGKFGKGFVTCRSKSGTGWSAPGAIRIEGGSVGFQIGVSQTDLVMLVMSERGTEQLLSSKFTLGAEVSVVAGPVGRTTTAQTDASLHADILSWSRTEGLFAGIAIEGATLRPDDTGNAELYGKKLDTRAIVMTGMAPPPAAAKLLALLNRYSAKEVKN